MSMDARRYDTERHHAAIHFLDSMLEPHSIPKTEASLLWLAFHSKLGPQDVIIFGWSNLHQVKQCSSNWQGPTSW
jgi:aflatoxin B1 aldehyde reductase